MPSLLSISRGAAASSSILRRHHHFRKHVLLFDASSSRYYSPSSSTSIEKSAWNITSRSAAAAMRNDSSLSSSRRVEESSSTSSKYNESNKQSTVDTDTTKTSNRQQQQPRAADWRAWFSSSEYDDPWSPYRPLRRPTTTTQQQEQPSSNTTTTTNATTLANISNTNSPNTVDNILTNYNHWDRRRHGVNLVPLSLHYNNKNSPRNNLHSTPIANDTGDNNDILHTTEQGAKLQKRTQWIDTQTRFTIQLLNDLYYTGIRRQMDRPTTERCHRMIGRLLSLTPREGNVVVHLGADSGDNDNNSGGAENNDLLTVVVQITGAAQRGNAILERMEWCSPAFLPQLRKWQRQQQQQQQGVMDEFDMSNVVSTTATDYPTKSVPKHLIQTKQVIPTPTLAIYNMVLLLYGKEAGSKYVAEQAEDVIWSMIVRGLQLEEFNESHGMIGPNDTTKKKKGAQKEEEKSGDGGGGEDTDTTTTTTSAEPIYPRTQNWNCVLQCWSNSTDSNRAFLAYSFFKSWMEWNAKCVGRGMGVEDARCDLESFHWILKSCVVEESTKFDDEGDNINSSSTTTGKKLITKRAKEVGSRVAMSLWRDMRVWKDHYNTDESSSTLTSDTYYQLLRALCQTSDLSRGWVATVAAVFQSCRSDGMETKEITNMVRGALTETQFQKLLLRSEVTSAASSKK